MFTAAAGRPTFPVQNSTRYRRLLMSIDVSAERAARNQTLFREINVRILEVNSGLDPQADRYGFLCECANTDCTKQIELTLAEYEAVRRDPRRFFVGPSEDHYA